MKELKVGMYAYSKHSRDYGIGKIVKIHTNGFAHQEVEIQYKNIKISTRYDYVIGSYNKIDLIEVGDYVNGLKITEIVNGVTKCLKTEYRLNLNYVYFCFYEKDIESIATKEQFESMSYKVGE